MGRYFDPNRTVDLDLLPVESRDATDLDLFASEAEADVINFYTRDLNTLNPSAWATIRPPASTQTTVYTALGTNLGVFLRFYENDADAVDVVAEDGAAFLLAMKRTIAAIITWRLLQSKLNTVATQETSAGRTLVKSMLQIEPYPPNWTRWLMPFSTLPPTFVL